MLRDEAVIRAEFEKTAARLFSLLTRGKEACVEARREALDEFEARRGAATTRYAQTRAVRDAEFARKLEEELGRIRSPDLRSQLAWSDAQLTPYTGRQGGAIETAAIRIGEFAFDSASAKEERVVLTFDVFCAASILVSCRPAERAKAISIYRSLVLRHLVSVSPGKLLLRLFDSKEHGKAFSSFIQSLPSDVSGGQAGVTMKELDAFLDELDRRIASVSQRFLNSDTPTLRTFNERTAGDLEPYYLFAIDNFPDGFDEKRATRVLRIAEHGPAAGVQVLLFTCNPSVISSLVKDSRFADCCIELRVANSGAVSVRQAAASLELSVIDEFPVDGRAETLFSAMNGRLREEGAKTESFSLGAHKSWWTESASAGIEVSVGRKRNAEAMVLAFDETGRNGALVAGGSGYGKSNLLHVVIARLMAKYDPRTLNLYLLDFKGVEFNVYHEFRPPHVRSILSDMNQKLGLAMLSEFQAILADRKRLFAGARRQKLSDYNSLPGVAPMPRVVVIIDEFQKLFMGDISMARQAEEIISNLLRQGRSYGIHLILASQNLSHQTTPRDIKTMFQTRIVLRFRSPSDYAMVLESEFDASGALKERGQALLDTGSGDPEFFLIPFLPFPVLESRLREMDALAAERRVERPDIVFLNGEEVASVDRNSAIKRLIVDGQPPGAPLETWIGDAFSLRGSASLTFRRQANSNLLVLSQERHACEAYGLITVMLLQVVAACPKNRCYVIVPEHSGEELALVRRLSQAIPSQVITLREMDLAAIGSLAEEAKAGRMDRNESVVVAFAGLQRLGTVRNEFQTLYSRVLSTREKTPALPSTGDHIKYLLDEGPRAGIHTVVIAESISGADRQVASRFNLRIGFRLTDTDSQSIFSSKAAEGLPDGFAVFVDKGEVGEPQEFRPYSNPSPDWIEQQANAINERKASVV